jgi:hypothetical protein
MIETKLQMVKVKLGDILPNPYRDFELYPYDQKKIWRLYKSFRKFGWWGNVVGRMRKDGKVELAYGHHRVEAMQRWKGPDWEIEVIVKDLTNKQMLQMMAGENDEAYNCSAAAIDNAVKSAKEYLRTHPGAARKVLASRGGRDVKRVREGAPMYATFLGKREYTVEKSIERLNLIESGVVAKEAMYLFPTFSSIDSFAKFVKDNGIKTVYQREIAFAFIKEKAFTFEKMEQAYILKYREKQPQEEHSSPDLRHKYQYEEAKRAFRELMEKTTALMKKLYWPLREITDKMKPLENRADRAKYIQDIIPQDMKDTFMQNANAILDSIKAAQRAVEIEEETKATTANHAKSTELIKKEDKTKG